MGSSLTIFVPHPVKGFLYLLHTQHLPESHLTSYEILLLTAPQITIVRCNSLSCVALPPSSTDEIPLECPTLIDQSITC